MVEAPLTSDAPAPETRSTSFDLDYSLENGRRFKGPLSEAVYSPVPILEPDQLVGSGEHIDQVRNQLATAADCDLATMIYGEHGAGKSLLARALHNRSARADRWLVVVDCELLEAGDIRPLLLGDLSGGASDSRPESNPREFRADAEGVFGAASGGTVVLDHVSALSQEAQSVLRHILETHTLERLGGNQSLAFDVRLVATAIPRRLRDSFQPALYYRLAQIDIRVPPLRDRGDDAVQLAYYFLQRRINRDEALGDRRFSEAAERALQSYHWPGNVNELRNVVSRALSAADGKEIEETDLLLSDQPLGVSPDPDPGGGGGSTSGTGEDSQQEAAAGSSGQAAGPLPKISDDDPIPTIEELKEAAVRRAYELCDHDVDRTAVELGVGRSTVYRMLDRYNIR